MDQENNSTTKIIEKQFHRIGSVEYPLTPSVLGDPDWVSLKELEVMFGLKEDAIKKLTQTWEKSHAMDGRVMRSFVRKSVAVEAKEKRKGVITEDQLGKSIPAGTKEGWGQGGKQTPPAVPQSPSKDLAIVGQLLEGYYSGEIAKKDEKIITLETKNELIVKELLKEKDEKTELKIKNNNLKHYLITGGLILLIGGGVAGYFIYTTNQDNDRLYAEKHTAVSVITSLNAENSNLKTKYEMTREENELLKKQGEAVTQNEEINAVKKD